jgi:hypothetical protein
VAGWQSLKGRIFKTEIEATEVTLVSPVQAAMDLTSTGYVTAQTQVSASLVSRSQIVCASAACDRAVRAVRTVRARK